MGVGLAYLKDSFSSNVLQLLFSAYKPQSVNVHSVWMASPVKDSRLRWKHLSSPLFHAARDT